MASAKAPFCIVGKTGNQFCPQSVCGIIENIQVLAGHSRNTTYTKQLIDIKDGKIPIPKTWYI